MIAPRLQQFLDEHKVLYTHTTHRVAYTAKDVAQADHTPPWELAKTVVFVGDDVYGMAVLPANTRVDLVQMREALGLKSFRLANEDELIRLFPDVEAGAMPPFGNLYGGIPVYLDTTLAKQETIAFNAGTHRDVVHMNGREYVHFVKPTILSFALPGRLAQADYPMTLLVVTQADIYAGG